MDKDKIGKFIFQLRKEKKMTQEKLSELIPIGREAISKWERGITIPDASTLIKLSDIFGVSINEILCGERLNRTNENKINNITLELYTKTNKHKKIIKTLVILLFTFLMIFLIYYFVNSYKSIKVYTISSDNENIKLLEGIFIQTKNKLYFRIGDFLLENDDKIEKLTLYYMDEDNAKKIIYNGESNYISLKDYKGYDEYFDSNKLDYIIKNMYLTISYAKNDEENIKLNFIQDYINSNIVFKKDKKSAFNTNANEDSIHSKYEDLISNIKKKFNLQEDIYTYEIKKKNIIKTFSYALENNNIYFSIIKDESITEDWIFDINNEDILYNHYDKEEVEYSFSYNINNDEINCINKNCQNEREKIDEFWEELSAIL